MKFFGLSTTKWRPCKTIAKLNGNHFLIANILKLYEYQTFGLFKMHNMCKTWFANSKFNSLIWNKMHFSCFLKGFQLPEIVLRPKAAPLTILAVKKNDFRLRNFEKRIKGRHFMGKSSTVRIWNFQLLLNSKSSKLSLHSLLKNISKIPILDLKKRGHFFKILFYVQSAAISVSHGSTS